MSSFKDTFTRDQGGDNNLQYDDTAFYYFFLTLLVLAIIPLIISIINQIFFDKEIKNLKNNCPCPDCKSKADLIRKSLAFSWLNKTLFFKLIVLITICVFMKDVYQNIAQSENKMKGFDPYEILEISHSATEQEIKKAYRKLSVRYHPDKNPDDPLATAKFILITKAHDCLTDEKAKVNCEKFGNPDGPGTFHVAIALPSFLLRKENHVAVLCFFFLILLIIIPTLVIWWYENSKRYDLDGTLLDNKKLYYRYLNENLIMKGIPEILAVSQEFKSIPVRSREEDFALTKLEKEVASEISKPKVERMYLKPLYLIAGHMMRAEIDEILKKDLIYILKEAPKLLDGMIDFAWKFPPGIKELKFMGLRCVKNLIEFKQMIIQGLWINDSPFLQMAYFQDEEKFMKFSKRSKKPANLLELIQTPIDQRKIHIIEEEKDEFNKQLSYFPNLKVETIVEVIEEKEIVEGDFVTIKVKMIRENLQDGQECRGIHSLKYPFVKEEKWILILANEEKNIVINLKYVSSPKKVIEEEFKIGVPLAGQINWTLYVKSDCYRGLDQEKNVKFTVLPANAVTREHYIHPDDAALDKEPSFMQQLMQGINPKENDSDEELEEEEEDAKKTKKNKKVHGDDKNCNCEDEHEHEHPEGNAEGQESHPKKKGE